MSELCAGNIYRGGFGDYHCHNKGKIEEGGKLWCRTHAPSLVAERRKARNAKWDAQWKESRERQAEAKAEQAELERRAECYPALLEALKAGLAERTNIGLDKPFWTPGLTEQYQAAIDAAS